MPVYRLAEQPWFPDPSEAEEDGLLAVGGDLSIERLITAYERGIFPWYNPDQPILWWSPPQRMVLLPDRLKVGKSLKKALSRGDFELRLDHDFEAVIEGCAAAPRKEQAGTWITDDIKAAYVKLHELGLAHSFESYQNGQLVGGLYGVSMGRAFFGESMFSKKSEASKFAFYHLHQFMLDHDFQFVDCQLHTDHLESLGACEVPREQFLNMLRDSLAYPDMRHSWKNEAT